MAPGDAHPYLALFCWSNFFGNCNVNCNRFAVYVHTVLQYEAMRIAFLGKGGSGKTTTSSFVARVAAEMYRELYVIDADINVHMREALGLSSGEAHEFRQVFEYVETKIRHDRPDVAALKTLPRTLPPWRLEDRYTLSFEAAPCKDLRRHDNMLLLELGSYTEDTMGWSCHHSALGTLQLVLAHMNDSEDQLIIADLTAGADVFGVGMLGLFDIVFVAVEPTMKSTNIYNQLTDLAATDDVALCPIANKIIDESDVQFIETRIEQPVKFTIGMSNFVRRLERGETVETADIELPTRQVLGEIVTYIQSVKRDEQRMFQSTLAAHRRAAKKWPKQKFPIDLMTLINPEYER